MRGHCKLCVSDLADAVVLDYLPPTIHSVTAVNDTLPAIGGVVLHLNGTNFGHSTRYGVGSVRNPCCACPGD